MSIESPQKNPAEELPNPNHVLPQPEVPENAASLTDSQAEKKGRIRPIHKVLAGVAGVAIAAGAAVGVGAALNQGPEKSEPVATAPADPGETDEPTSPETDGAWSPEVTVEQLEIPAGLETEQLGQEIIERLDDWQNAGTDNETVIDDWQASPLKTEVFAQRIAEQYAPIYETALFADGWESHDDLTKLSDFYREINPKILGLNLVTSSDGTAYHRNISFEAAREISNDGSTRVIEVDFIESNNADRNRVGEIPGTENESTFGNPTGTYTFTLSTVAGTEKITASSIR